MVHWLMLAMFVGWTIFLFDRMRGFYTIQTQAEFDASLANQPAGL